MRERSNPNNTSNSTYKEGVYKWSAEEEEEEEARRRPMAPVVLE